MRLGSGDDKNFCMNTIFTLVGVEAGVEAGVGGRG